MIVKAPLVSIAIETEDRHIEADGLAAWPHLADNEVGAV